MPDLPQTRSALEAGNPPATPGITHSDVVVNLFRELAPQAVVPGTVAPSATSASNPAVPLPSPALPGRRALPDTPPPIQPGLVPDATTAEASRIPLSFEPFGSEVLKSLQESGIGISAFDEPALPLPHGAAASPDYYFLAPQP